MMIDAPKQPLKYEGELSRVYKVPLYEQVDIQEMITAAYARGEKEITIPPGAYRIHPRDGEIGHICLYDMKDFTINAYGVVFLYQNRKKHGLTVRRSENITVRGLTSDYEDLIFTQCKLVEIGPDKDYYIFEVDKGYGQFTEEDLQVNDSLLGPIHDSETGLWIPCSQKLQIPIKNITLLGDRRFRADHMVEPIYRFFKPGDYWCPMNIGNRPGAGINTNISASGALHFEDYTVWSSAISAICECYSEGGTTYRNVKIVPGPKPYEADHRRLLAMAGDGFHLTSGRRGPIIENTVVDGLTDDGINIHGSYGAIDTKLSDTKLIISNSGGFEYRVGDTIRIYDENLDIIQHARVVNSKIITDTYKPENPITIKLACSTFVSKGFHELELDTPILANRGDWVVNANCIGAGFEFRNCSFSNLTPRGILIKSSDGIVENCQFDYCQHAAIRITPEHEWSESDYSSNVIVRNCTIRRCGSISGYKGYGISINGHEAIEHHNIILENNHFEDNFNRDLHITCGQDIIVRNNTFGEVNPLVDDLRPDLVPVIYVNYSKRVTFENNTYSPNRLVGVIGPEAEGIQTDGPFHSGSFSADCIFGGQGRGGWRWQYATIGQDNYQDYPNWRTGKGDDRGWWKDEIHDYTHGNISKLWWNSYMYPGTQSDVIKSYTCPKDGIVAVTTAEPIKAGDIFDITDPILVKILKNDEPVWPVDREWAEVELFRQLPCDIHTVAVKAGDVIHFRANMNQVPQGNGLSWAPMVYYIEE